MIRRSVFLALGLALAWSHAAAQAADAQTGTWVATQANPAILLGDGFYPINVLTALKLVPEVCRIFCATSNATG